VSYDYLMCAALFFVVYLLGYFSGERQGRRMCQGDE
jgi:hypothetical protein